MQLYILKLSPKTHRAPNDLYHRTGWGAAPTQHWHEATRYTSDQLKYLFESRLRNRKLILIPVKE